MIPRREYSLIVDSGIEMIFDNSFDLTNRNSFEDVGIPLSKNRVMGFLPS